MAEITYKAAGVDVAVGNQVVREIKSAAQATYNSAVLAGVGGFGALYDLSVITQQYQHPVLVQSIDGLGTKPIVARLANDYRYLGQDLVSATANDILVMGAKPLTLMDYVAVDSLELAKVTEIICGIAQACQAEEIALIGGETAEMPNTYLPGEHDIVGVVTGVVDKNKVIDGSMVKPGDKVFGLPSTGLHTNGYSLARKLCFEVAGWRCDEYIEELGMTLASALLAPHRNYTKPVHAVLNAGAAVKAMVHVTGGGLIENIPRVLPQGLGVRISQTAWTVPPLFKVLQKIGKLTEGVAYQTFNMGIGYLFIGDESIAKALCENKIEFFQMGEVVAQTGVEFSA